MLQYYLLSVFMESLYSLGSENRLCSFKKMPPSKTLLEVQGRERETERQRDRGEGERQRAEDKERDTEREEGDTHTYTLYHIILALCWRRERVNCSGSPPPSVRLLARVFIFIAGLSLIKKVFFKKDLIGSYYMFHFRHVSF